MTSIKIQPLGAGQDVGRSCIIVSIKNINIMLDCGMHMGFNDSRKFPDFSSISKNNTLDDVIDCVLISHFHLDHSGALPYMTQVIGYSGPIYMTEPTKAICPELLRDNKIESKRDPRLQISTAPTFTPEHITSCIKKILTIPLHKTITIKTNKKDPIFVTAYYAGHVLGAVMFQITVDGQTVVYTGDYNMTPDRHLGSAWISKCRPDVLITESTYATLVRDSKRARERDFLQKIHSCVLQGGKVLIPVFALGRAQELCILIDSYWDRVGLKIPVYFSAGLTERALDIYRLFIDWTNEKIKSTSKERNMFDFKYITSFDANVVHDERPMVLFSSPGMLHQGQSLEIFKKWCHDPKNMIIMPGYCVAGTVGAKVLSGQAEIEINPWTTVTVKMKVENLSFSAHADSKGIKQLIKMCEPKNIVLVHGEKHKMIELKTQIEKEMGITTYYPANATILEIETHKSTPKKTKETNISPIKLNKLKDVDGSLNMARLNPQEKKIEPKKITENKIKEPLTFSYTKFYLVHKLDLKTVDEAQKCLLEKALNHIKKWGGVKESGIHMQEGRIKIDHLFQQVEITIEPTLNCFMMEYVESSHQLCKRIKIIIHSMIHGHIKDTTDTSDDKENKLIIE